MVSTYVSPSILAERDAGSQTDNPAAVAGAVPWDSPERRSW